MTKKEHERLMWILTQPRFTHSKHLEEWVKTVEVSEEPKGNRTSAQNAALHLDCKLIAEKLDAAGLDMKAVLKPTYQLPWTTESVKEHIWRPIMKALYGIESTKDLKKTEQIDKIHETIMRELGEKHHIEWHDFPSDEQRALESARGYLGDDIRNDPSFDKYYD